MEWLLGFSRAVDRVTAFIGRTVMWLLLASVFVSALNAVFRKMVTGEDNAWQAFLHYVLRWYLNNSNAWLELQWYMFGCAYMLASAYTLQRNEHIRIDVVSNLLPKRVRDWIDVFGHVFMLIPFSLLMIRETWGPITRSFNLGEMSANFGGLIVWPYKAFVLIGFILLFIQAVSELSKRIAIMRGVIPDPHAQTSSHAPPQVEEGAV
jgi:TRAP-type mannitol/chloroaromatic compound transport system permease small subunit